MVIEKLVDRELTKDEIDSIKQFRRYTDGVSYACIEEQVMIMLDIEDKRNPEKLKSAAMKIVNEALDTPPDFEVFFMDDGVVLLMLTCGVFTFTKLPIEENEKSISLYLLLRNHCLCACDEAFCSDEILAVVYEE